MPADLYTNLNAEFPASMAIADENLILIATGTNPMMRWNGLRSVADTAGVILPSTILTITSPNAGAVTISTGSRAYQRFVDYDGNVSNISEASASFTCSAKKILYANLAIPTETKVTKRQIFRTLDGGSAVIYLDVETTDLSVTTLESNNPDGTISLAESITLVDSDGDAIADVHGVPPGNKAVVCSHQGRVFASVEISYDSGQVSVTNGSATVVGTGTKWTQSFIGRFLYVAGAPTYYEILAIGSVDATNQQTMTLTSIYTGPTEQYAEYAIRAHPDKRRSVAYSEAFLPQSWDATKEIVIQETGSQITGLVSHGSFLYVLERERIHRFTYQDAPELDGAVFLSAYRGCINNRCWAAVQEFIYMLDEQGVHRFDGARQVDQVSTPIQDMFRDDSQDFRINWSAARWFHAIHYPAQETIRWFVALSGQKFPRHSLAFNHSLNRWWIEEYRIPIGSSTQIRVDTILAGIGSWHGQTHALAQGYLDGTGDTVNEYGSVTSATELSLTDSLASFPASGCVNCPLAIVSGRGKGQIRQIVSNTGTKLVVRHPWGIVPDSTSKYLIGAVPWRWKSGWQRWMQIDDNTDLTRYIEAIYDPVSSPAWMDVRVYADFSAEPSDWSIARDDTGIVIEAGKPDMVYDLARADGSAVQRLDDGKDAFTSGEDWIAVELKGFGVRSKVAIHEVNVGGTE